MSPDIHSIPSAAGSGLVSAADAAAASGRANQLRLEDELVSYLEEQGLEIYEPDLTAFREHVQAEYVGSEFAASWPDGVLEQINALGN